MDRPAVVTLFFCSCDDPASVLRTEPRADRGFGRKYLAQLNPAWPITPIGQFSLNRSTPPSANEFYIGGFNGVSVVQTYLPDLREISTLDEALRTSLPADDVYVLAEAPERGYGACAHWSQGELVRAFAARRDRVYEDEGIPLGFELPFWSGETAETEHQEPQGIALPFEPIDLVRAAAKEWLGIRSNGPDINVVAFAVDGRPEPRLYTRPPAHERRVAQHAIGSAAADRDYDDYADDSTGSNGPTAMDTAAKWARHGGTVALKIGSVALTTVVAVSSVISDKLRHTDRPGKLPPEKTSE